jgi:hypothetical protein
MQKIALLLMPLNRFILIIGFVVLARTTVADEVPIGSWHCSKVAIVNTEKLQLAMTADCTTSVENNRLLVYLSIRMDGGAFLNGHEIATVTQDGSSSFYLLNKGQDGFYSMQVPWPFGHDKRTKSGGQDNG